jgi:serine protease
MQGQGQGEGRRVAGSSARAKAVLMALCTSLAFTFVAPAAWAAPVARVIVQFKAGAQSDNQAQILEATQRRQAGERRLQRLAGRQGLTLRAGRRLGDHTQALEASGVSTAELMRRLQADPDIAWVAENKRRRAQAFPSTAPSDPLFGLQASNNPGPKAGQWALRSPETIDGHFTASATRLQSAWQRSLGTGQVVAVLDTGTTAHEDLNGRLLPGRDFIAEATVANDGGARDGDASDPGDWVTRAEANNADDVKLYGCGEPVYDPFTGEIVEYRELSSSWHGTHVASLLAAASDNGVGMAGGAPGVRILPVRVLGKCGGYDDDIIAGMLWAAGVHQDGVPDNPNPARVINLSLGSGGACTQPYVDALAQIHARGAVVVAAAGNDAGLAVSSPANCPSVIAVAGIRHEGDKVGYSNLGHEVTISAPAGNCVNDQGPCLFPLTAATNPGLTSPDDRKNAYTDSLNPAYGTSYAAPLVSATVALMLAVRPDLTPADVKRILQASASAFPTVEGSLPCQAPSDQEQLACTCTTALCGAGMLNAEAAVAAAEVDAGSASRHGGGAVSIAAWLLMAAMALLLRCWSRAAPAKRPRTLT